MNALWLVVAPHIGIDNGLQGNSICYLYENKGVKCTFCEIYHHLR
jgi:hypothetical protein